MQRTAPAMPYVQRNSAGRIVALMASGTSGEFLPPQHPEVIEFLATPSGDGSEDTANVDLFVSDLKMIRVIEDVIDILIAKNVIMFSELPLPVQEKILQKKGQREKLFGGVGNILSDGEIF